MQVQQTTWHIWRPRFLLCQNTQRQYSQYSSPQTGDYPPSSICQSINRIPLYYDWHWTQTPPQCQCPCTPYGHIIHSQQLGTSQLPTIQRYLILLRLYNYTNCQCRLQSSGLREIKTQPNHQLQSLSLYPWRSSHREPTQQQSSAYPHCHRRIRTILTNVQCNPLQHRPPSFQLRKQFKPNRPNAKLMYDRATTFPSPLGILHTADHHWNSKKTRQHQFFGHSHTAPTPSITINEEIGLTLTKAYSHHILKSTRNMIFSQSQHPSLTL